jgi:hypothetical protein
MEYRTESIVQAAAGATEIGSQHVAPDEAPL